MEILDRKFSQFFSFVPKKRNFLIWGNPFPWGFLKSPDFSPKVAEIPNLRIGPKSPEVGTLAR